MRIHAELRLTSKANADAPRPLRHLLDALLAALEVADARRADIVLAVGEVLANAVEHAYANSEIGTVEIAAQSEDDDTLLVEVSDHGRFIEREGTPGRGFGLRIVRNIARDVVVARSEGTRIRMTFDLREDPVETAGAQS